jgi:hypothetical protein
VTLTVAEQWVEVPLRQFADDARVRLVLLLHPSGQVVGQYGFTRAVDVVSACALAAAIHASAGELGRALEGKPFVTLHHAGRLRQLFLASVTTPRGPYLFVTAFDQASSLGLVRLYFAELERSLAASAPPPRPRTPALADDLESELNRNLAALFPLITRL